jgi:hypothetical protein
MTEQVFNQTLPAIGKALVPPTNVDLDNVSCFKYADYDYVMSACQNDYVRYVLGHIPILGKHTRVLIDVKVHDLDITNVACIPGWHLDGSINPHKLPKQPEIFTLFVTGQHALTEFLAKPFIMDVDPNLPFDQRSNLCARKIPKDHPVWSMPSCQFGTYGDSYFHRGKPSTGKERRLLVRTTETDIIQPKNHIYTPYTHQ